MKPAASPVRAAALAVCLLAACGAEPSPREVGSAEPPAWLRQPLEARGNEPFWNLRIDGGKALYRTPEEIEGLSYRGVWEALPAERGWRWHGRRAAPSGGPEVLAVEIVDRSCIDSMSGFRFPHRATLERDDGRHAGCAGDRLSAPDEASPNDDQER